MPGSTVSSAALAVALALSPAFAQRPESLPEAALGPPDAGPVRIQATQTPRAPLAVFDETETILVPAPPRQVAWARAYASCPGRGANAAAIQAAVRAAFPNDPPGMHAQTTLLTQLILMGDIVGALRAQQAQAAAANRRFSRTLLRELERVQQARTTVIRNFARHKPPHAYVGDPGHAARAQDRSARYTQYLQVSAQLMSELQNTERELVDMLQTMHRNMQAFWESYASFRDQEFRTNERVMTTR